MTSHMTEIDNLERINIITLWKSEYLLGHQEKAESVRVVTRIETATMILVTDRLAKTVTNTEKLSET